jgi:DNA-binding transcriptional LysR family regulator
MNIDYRYLKAFSKTAELLSFSKAADSLKISQSAVSRQIKLLEESVGEQLVLRSSKKVLLTDKGRELLNSIKYFEKQVENVFEQKKKTIKVGILHGLLENWFIKIAKELKKKFDYNLIIEVAGLQTLQEKIQNGYFDVTITISNIQTEIVSSLKIFEERPVLISKGDINLKDIQKMTWIVYDKDDYLFKNYKNHSKNIIEVNSVTSIVKMVKEGLGVAIVAGHIISPTDKVTQNTVKGLNKENIYINMPNFKKQPLYIERLKSVVSKNIN